MKTLLALLFLSVPLLAQRPNIIVIVVDDLGHADMSFRDNAPKDINTPGIDRLAREGTIFETAYATAPICSPARTGLITGRYQQRWGNYWYGEGGLPSDQLTIPAALKKAGYQTMKVGKTHHNGGTAQYPLDHGFDDFFGFVDHTWDYLRLSSKDIAHYGPANARAAHIGPLDRNRKKESYEGRYTTELFTEEAVKFIDRVHRTPFYLQLSYNAVHHPTYIGHPDYLKKFGIEQFPFWDPKKENYKSWHRKWGHMGRIDPNGRKRYLATLACLDDGISTIINKLEDKKIRDNTMIVFLSDNGGTINTYADNGKLNGFKYMFGDGGLRIPLLISWPGKIPTAKRSALVSSLDVMPTILEAAGISRPQNLDGKSLWPAFKSDVKVHGQLFWSDSRTNEVVRRGNWKLIKTGGWEHRNFRLDKGKVVEDKKYVYAKGLHLFDLENDPGETKNLAEQNPEVVAKLSRLYKEWRQQMGQPVSVRRKKKKK